MKKDQKSQKGQKSRKRSKIDIYVVRLSKNGEYLANSKPCVECVKTMKKAGVDKIIYSNGNGEIVSEKVDAIQSDHMGFYQLKLQNYVRIN